MSAIKRGGGGHELTVVERNFIQPTNTSNKHHYSIDGKVKNSEIKGKGSHPSRHSEPETSTAGEKVCESNRRRVPKNKL